MSDTLGIYDDVVCLTFFTIVDDVVDNALLIVIIFLRKKYVIRTIGNRAPKSDISGMTSHNLNNADSFVR